MYTFSPKVEYEGRLWSLSAFCGIYLPENMHNASEAYQGPKYFSYQGKTLSGQNILGD